MKTILLLLALLTAGCSSVTQGNKGSAISVGYRDVNGVRYIATIEGIKQVGKEIPSKESKTSEFFEIPDLDPNEAIAMKKDSGGYIKLVRKDIWCASPQASDPALQTAGQCTK